MGVEPTSLGVTRATAAVPSTTLALYAQRRDHHRQSPGIKADSGRLSRLGQVKAVVIGQRVTSAVLPSGTSSSSASGGFRKSRRISAFRSAGGA